MIFQKKFEIFLDMDGVLSNFDHHLDAHGYRKENGTPDWDRMDYEWWATMPALDGARDFYDAVKGSGETYFLTSPGLSSGCFGGKAHWITQFLPEQGKFALARLTVTKNKHFLARPNRILIDDTPEKIEKWVEAGGIGILHKGDYSETLARLQQIVKKKPDAKVRSRNKPKNQP